MAPPVRLRAAAAAALLAAAVASSWGDVVATVRQRLLDELCYPPADTNLTALVLSAREYASTQRANGTWPDIDYWDSTDRAEWKADGHMERTNVLAAAAAWPTSPAFGDAALYNASRQALRAWSEMDPYNTNWWWMIISLPQAYGCLYLVLGSAPDALRGGFPDAFELGFGLEMSYRAAWWNASLGYEVTGANLAWMVQAQLARAVWPFRVNASALDQGFARLWAEVKVVNRSLDMSLAQGIQHDWSYQFHGPQLQVGSYGQDATGDNLMALVWSRGTRWAPPPSVIGLLCSFWALGQAPLTMGVAFDWSSVGRQVSRVGINSEYGATLNVTRVRLAAGVCPDPAQGEVLRGWADRMADVPNPAPLVGTTHFWASDATVHRRPGWIAFVHTHSTRTRVPECGNGENLKGRYMGEGTLSVYSTDCSAGGLRQGCGGEFGGVFPLWDWTLVPGTLAPADVPVPNCSSACCWTAQVTSGSFVVGASDGAVAAAAMDTHIYNVTARRSWHLLPDVVVVLASAVTDGSEGHGHHLRTALAQQWLHAPTVAVGFPNGTRAALPDGNYSLPGAAWLHADFQGWIPLPAASGAPDGVPVPHLSPGYRTGNYDTIGPTNEAAGGRTLQAWLDHGVGVRGGSWGYIHVPNVTADAMPAVAAAGAGVQLVANTDTVHAVALVSDPQALTVTAVFWPPPGCPDDPTQPSGGCPGGGLAWAPAGETAVAPLSLNVSAPCAVTYTEAGGSVTLAVANPDTPGGLVVRVTLSRSLAPSAACAAAPGPAPGSTVVTVTLPGDPLSDMGKSAVATCAIAG